MGDAVCTGMRRLGQKGRWVNHTKGIHGGLGSFSFVLRLMGNHEMIFTQGVNMLRDSCSGSSGAWVEAGKPRGHLYDMISAGSESDLSQDHCRMEGLAGRERLRRCVAGSKSCGAWLQKVQLPGFLTE